jgi:hypothetical protein
MPWITDVHFTDVEGSFGDFMLTQDLGYLAWDGEEWIVPAKFVGDLSSIPFFLRWLIPKTILGKSPWLHDYLYRMPLPDVDRKKADFLFYTGAIDEGMKPWKAEVMYRGLRLGGWASWNKYRQ